MRISRHACIPSAAPLQEFPVLTVFMPWRVGSLLYRHDIQVLTQTVRSFVSFRRHHFVGAAVVLFLQCGNSVPIDIPAGLTRTEGTASTIAWRFAIRSLSRVSVAVIAVCPVAPCHCPGRPDRWWCVQGSCAWLFVGTGCGRGVLTPGAWWWHGGGRWCGGGARHGLHSLAPSMALFGVPGRRRVFILIANNVLVWRQPRWG
jgi:hypothetical protein